MAHASRSSPALASRACRAGSKIKSAAASARRNRSARDPGPARCWDKFLESLPEIRELLSTDIEAAYEGDPAALSSEEIVLSYPFVETIAIQRAAHRLYEAGVPLLPRMMTEWVHARTGIDIHPGARIGSHFFIDHGTGVVIGETCHIGAHVKLYHGVTLGARSFQKDAEGRLVKGGKRHPNVEDWVTIYPNSTVLGGETVIGERSTIGANVFLMHSVAPRSLVYYEETQLKVLSKRDGPRRRLPRWNGLSRFQCDHSAGALRPGGDAAVSPGGIRQPLPASMGPAGGRAPRSTTLGIASPPCCACGRTRLFSQAAAPSP